MESGLQFKSRHLKSNTQDTIRRSRNKRQTLRYHSPSPDTQKRKRHNVTRRARTSKRILRVRLFVRGHAERISLRHCVAGQEGRGFVGIFHWQSVRSMALGSTRHIHIRTVLKSGSPNLVEPSEPLQVRTLIAFLFSPLVVLRSMYLVLTKLTVAPMFSIRRWAVVVLLSLQGILTASQCMIDWNELLQ